MPKAFSDGQDSCLTEDFVDKGINCGKFVRSPSEVENEKLACLGVIRGHRSNVKGHWAQQLLKADGAREAGRSPGRNKPSHALFSSPTRAVPSLADEEAKA